MFPSYHPHWLAMPRQAMPRQLALPSCQPAGNARVRYVTYVSPSHSMQRFVTLPGYHPSQAMQREVDWLAMRLKLHARPLDASSPPPPSRPPPPSSPPLRRPTTADLKHAPTRLKPPPRTPTLTLTLALTP